MRSFVIKPNYILTKPCDNFLTTFRFSTFFFAATNEGQSSTAGGASKLDTSTLAVKDAAAPLGASRMPFPQLLEHVSAVISFVWSELFASDEVNSLNTFSNYFIAIMLNHSPILHIRYAVERPAVYRLHL